MSIFGASPRQAQEATATDGFEYALPINPYELTPGQLDQALKIAKDAGVTSVSAGATWSTLDFGLDHSQLGGSNRDFVRQKRETNWRTNPWHGTGKSSLESLIAKATAPEMGMKVNLQLNGPVEWAPRTDAELDRWSEYVEDVVKLSNERVSSFEMWNEPNLPRFWPTNPGATRPDPGEYVEALKAGYFAAKNADTNMTNEDIVFAGLSHNDVGYLDRYYAEAKTRSRYPGEAAANRYYFDVLGVHPYAYDRSPSDNTGPVDWSYDDVIDRNFGGLYRMKGRMEEEKGTEASKAIWIGEMGYAMNCMKTVHCVSDKDAVGEDAKDVKRAEYLKEAYSLARDLGYVNGMSWYHYLPQGFSQPGSDDDAGWDIARFDSVTSTSLKTSATFEALKRVATEPRVDALQADRNSYVSGEAVRVTATLSAPRERVLGRVVVAVRKGGVNFDFHAQDNVAVGPAGKTLYFEKLFSREGTYQYYVSYSNDGGVTWNPLTPTREFSVGVAPAPAPTPAPTPAPAPVYSPPPNYAAPTISGMRPTNGSSTRDRTPRIIATVRDSQTDLAKGNVALLVDNRRVSAFGYNQATNRLTYTSRTLGYGRHTVKVVANDGQISKSRTWRFTVVR